ncbi:MAG: hypothetical protein ACT4PL_13420 [Phycisphaerales bacterium]
MTHTPNLVLGRAVGLALAAGWAAVVLGGPVVENSPAPGAVRAVSAGGAALAGVVALADTGSDAVEARDPSGTLLRTITRAQMLTLAPWLTLSSELDDGPVAVAVSDSGRLVFAAVRSDGVPGDGLASDAVFRMDTETGTVTLFARLELGGSPLSPRCGLVHFKGRLYVAFGGQVRVYIAGANTSTVPGGTPFFTVTSGSTGLDMSLAVDRSAPTGPLLFVTTGDTLMRAPISGASSLPFTTLGSVSGLKAIAWSDHYGAAGGLGGPGLYCTMYAPGGGTFTQIRHVTAAAARGQQAFAASGYLVGSGTVGAPAATADGRLIVPTQGPSVLSLRDDLDTRLTFDGWKSNEFAQVVAFGRGLIAPDGEPSGWVIDADAASGGTRFHPATPDGAAWVVFLLLMNHHLTGDPAAQGQIRTILTRYAGRAADGIAPSRTADGIYRHWLNPVNGSVKPGWNPEFSTLSTMKIVAAAERAAARFPQDAEIQASARAIVCEVRNLGAYFHPTTRALYLKGLAGGGPDLGTPSGPYHEGVIFAEQASSYAGANVVLARWLDRSQSPGAITVIGQPVTGDVTGQFQSAFVSLYSLLLQAPFRTSPSWQSQIRAIRISHAAWTDDNAPQWNTVFSAGTTRSDWGGYAADSLSVHTGDISTFTSLLAMCAGDGSSGGRVNEAYGAYQAYRRGASQTFASGASILYRRSSVDPSYTPNSAGLPDVALGALGLAEILLPGSVATVLTGGPLQCSAPPPPDCGADFNSDGITSPDDLDEFITAYFEGETRADFDDDGILSPGDLDEFITSFFGDC